MAFGWWLSGFIDGEGCFTIHRQPNRGGTFTWKMLFHVGLRLDDIDTLRLVQSNIGGRIHVRRASQRSNPSAQLTVGKADELFALVDLIDRHPLRSKKRGDFAIWREAVVLHHTAKRAGTPGVTGCRKPDHVKKRIGELYEELKAYREYFES